MKIILILIIIILIVATVYYYATTTKNWFNAKGEYPEFPFKFEVFNEHGFQVLNQDPEEINSAGLLIQLNTLSPSLINNSLPNIRLRKNIDLPETMMIEKGIILDSKTFGISDIGSGLFVYVISIPLSPDHFTITVSGSSKERIDEVLTLLQKSFKFKYSTN